MRIKLQELLNLMQNGDLVKKLESAIVLGFCSLKEFKIVVVLQDSNEKEITITSEYKKDNFEEYIINTDENSKEVFLKPIKGIEEVTIPCEIIK